MSYKNITAVLAASIIMTGFLVNKPEANTELINKKILLIRPSQSSDNQLDIDPFTSNIYKLDAKKESGRT